MAELSFVPSTLDLEVYNRDTVDLLLTLKTGSGTYVTLPSNASNVQWTAQVRNGSGSLVASFIVSASDSTSASALRVYLPSTNLSACAAGGLEYDVQVFYTSSTNFNATASFTETYLRGDITVIDDITN